jgi:prophage tail gpP-like protein
LTDFSKISVVRSEPEKDTVELLHVDSGKKINRWKEYQVNSDFLTPADGWSFRVAAGDLASDERAVLQPGAQVQLSVNGYTQLEGTIDLVETSTSRSGGTEINIQGRDLLAECVDSCADPKIRLKPNDSLYTAVSKIFEPFGINPSDYLIDEQTDRDLRTGTNYTKGGRREKKPTKRARKIVPDVGYQRPHPHEGAFAFASRLAQRFGFWIWMAASGKIVIIGKPNFDQEPLHEFRSKLSDTTQNNILESSLRLELSEQPSVIYAEGSGGGGEFGKAKHRAFMTNPALDVADDPAISTLLTRFPGATELAFPAFQHPRLKARTSRPMYLHDEESKTFEQLEKFIQREMATRVRRAYTYHCKVVGHYNRETGGIYCVNTVANVIDDNVGAHERLWIKSRTFRKSRTGGSETELELIRLNSLEF